MVPNRSTGIALRLALVAAAAISMSACATKKPVYPATPAPAPAPQPPPPAPPGVTQTPVAPPAGPVAGSEQDFVVNVGDRVYFDFDAYNIRGDAAPLLAQQAAWLKRYPAVQVRIEGNCDERGTREYNLALGARRANSVRSYLISQGVDANRISTVSYGKEKPIDSASGDEADQHNRNAHTAIVSGARMQ